MARGNAPDPLSVGTVSGIRVDEGRMRQSLQNRRSQLRPRGGRRRRRRRRCRDDRVHPRREGPTRSQLRDFHVQEELEGDPDCYRRGSARPGHSRRHGGGEFRRREKFGRPRSPGGTSGTVAEGQQDGRWWYRRGRARAAETAATPTGRGVHPFDR